MWENLLAVTKMHHNRKIEKCLPQFNKSLIALVIYRTRIREFPIHFIFTGAESAGMRIALLIVLAGIGVAAYAQESVLAGYVTDARTGDAIIGANVVTQSGVGSATDLNGFYRLQLDAGDYFITCSYVGYEKISDSISIGEGAADSLNFQLSPEPGILNTVVVSGSKFEKTLGEETVTLDVIKPSLIQNTNDISLDMSVQRMPGVNVIDGQANIRGGSGYSYGAGSRVLLLMDDLPVLTGDAAFPSWDFIPIENIGQVEIIKGAASALYGSSAMNGIINVRTAYPTTKPETTISIFNGAFFHPKDTAQQWWGDNFPIFTGASFSHRQKYKRLDIVTGGYLFDGDSYLQDVYDRRLRGTLNLRYRLNANFSAGINLNAQVNRSTSFFFWSSIDTGLYVPYPSTLTYNRGFKVTVDPFINYYDRRGNRHKLITRYYGNHNETLTNEQSNFNDLYYLEYQYQKHFSGMNLVLTSGLVGSATRVRAQLYGDSTYHASNEAAYLQLDKKFYAKLNVSAGMRYEMNQIAGLKEARPVFRFGANYQAGPYTYLRASWGQGYRFPTIAEKYVSTNISLLGIFPNPDLRSETGWTGEIGLKQGVKVSSWQGYADLSAFISEYFNMMEFTFGYYPESGADFPFGFESRNIGDTRITGAEISLIGEGKIGDVPTTLIAGYTYINPVFQHFDSLQNALSSADYNVLKYRFRHVVKLDVESTVKKFRIGLSFNYFSFMEAVDAAFVDPVFPGSSLYIVPGLQEYRDTHDHGDYVFDLRFAYAISSTGEIAILCNNVLNREYSVRPAMMEATRNITLKYTLHM